MFTEVFHIKARAIPKTGKQKPENAQQIDPLKVELNYSVKQRNKKVGKVEGQEDYRACICANSVHKGLYPRLAFEVFVGTVVIHFSN